MEDKVKHSLEKFKDVLATDPTSSKPLDALIDVEDKIREINEPRKLTNKQIDRVLKGVEGRTIDEVLDEVHDRAMQALEDKERKSNIPIDEYIRRLKIVFRKAIDTVILEPMYQRPVLGDGSKPFERPEVQTSKLQLLLELLRDNNIYTDDICIIMGENREGMMRKGSYLCIEIPSIHRTILLHPEYAEATFVLHEIYDRDDFFSMTKEDIQEKLGAIKVIFYEDKIDEWRLRMLDALKLNIVGSDKKVDIKKYDERKFLISEIKKLYPTPKSFMALTKSKRDKMNINGKGIYRMANIIYQGKKRLDVISKKEDLIIFLREVYGHGHDIIECELWGKEKWIEEMKKLFPDPKDLMNTTQKQRGKIKIHGKGITFIGNIITDGPNKISPFVRKDLALLAREIYGDGHDIIECELWDKERWKEEILKEYDTPEKFMGMDPTKRKEFNILGRGLTGFATDLLGESKKWAPIGTLNDFALLAQELYGEGHDIIECELWDKKRWIEELKKIFPTPEDFMKQTKEKVTAFSLFGKGIGTIGKIMLGYSVVATSSRKDLAMIAKEIYGEGHTVIELESWDKERWEQEFLKEFPTPESLMFASKEKKNILIHGKGLTAFASEFVKSKKRLGPISTRRDRALLAREMYGEGHDIIECELWDKKKWMEEVKKKYKTPEDFMGMNQDERFKFSVGSRGITGICSVILGRKDLVPTGNREHLAILARGIYGEGHEVIECEFWDNEKWLEALRNLCPKPEDLMKLSQKEKKEINIYNRGIIGIARIILNNKDINPMRSMQDLALLAKAMYGEGHDIIECEFWDKEKWIQEIKERYPTPDIFMGSINKNNRKFELFGKTLTKITEIIIPKKKLGFIINRKKLAFIAREIYGEGHDIIECEFWKRARWKEEIKKVHPTPESFMAMSNTEQGKFKIQGRGLKALGSKIFRDGKGLPTGSKTNLAILAKSIYGDKHDVIKENLKLRESEVILAQEWIEEIKKLYPDPKDFMSLTQAQKKVFKINGKGLIYIAKRITGKKLRPTTIHKEMAILAHAIYGEDHEVIECELWSKDRWIEEIKKLRPTPESFVLMTKKQRKEFSVCGKKIHAIKSILEIDTKSRAYSIKGLCELALVIYGKVSESIESELWSANKWKNEMKKRFPTPEDFMSMSRSKRMKFKVHEKNLDFIATAITGEKNFGAVAKTHRLALLAREIYGEGHEVIEQHLQENESDKWEKEKWIEEIKKRYPTPEEFMEHTRDMKIEGKGFQQIGTILLGVGEISGSKSKFNKAKLALVVYGEGHEVIKQHLEIPECETWDADRWKAEIRSLYPNPQVFTEMFAKDRMQLKIHGKGLKAISSIVFGHTKFSPVKKIKDLQVFLEEVYIN